MLITCIY